MKIRGSQIEFTAAEAAAIVALGGGTPSSSSADVVTLEDVDNGDNNGVLEIPSPTNGVCYRGIYPTTSIILGAIPEGATIWVEMTCGSVRNTPMTLAGEDEIFFTRASDHALIEVFSEGNYYQLRFRNIPGRVYGEFMYTEILAPIIEEEEA